MAKRDDKSTAAIQRLLDERRKIEQWLNRLDMAADKATGAVRNRVRTDYERRLGEVTEELQGYEGDLRKALERHRATHDGLKRQEQEASDELAEAELRHAVGEFDEGEWRDRKAEILERLVKVREGLADAEREIGELDGVLQFFEARAAPDEIPEPEDEVPPPPETPEPAPASAGTDAPPAAKKRPSGQTDVFNDELAFLRSVTEDEDQGPRASRASGGVRIPPEAKEAQPAPVRAKPKEPKAPADVGAGGAKAEPAESSVGQSRPSVVNQRTLKCGECGAMNLPTEWYCERCGAELAAL